jgi:uncharacterized protein
MTKDSLLWEISGNYLKKPSYIYGTIHIQDKRVFTFDNIVYEKFNECEAFAMEALIDDIDPLSLQNVFLMKRHTLKSLLEEDIYDKLKIIIQKELNSDISIFEKTKPMFISSLLIQSYEAGDMAEALDMYFLKLAKEKNKEIFGIETFNQQLSVVKKISIKEQCDMLIDMIKEPDLLGKKFNDLLEAYINADLNKILKLSKEKALSNNFNNVFIKDRNKRMARKIISFSKKHSTFNTLGAGHLPGDDGIVNLLKNKGYTLTPIKFGFNNREANNN